MKTYTVTQRVYSYDYFDESDIPEGMTAEQYAEARYEDNYGDLDSHDLMLIIQEDGQPDVIIDPVPTEDDEREPYRTSEDDNPEFWMMTAEYTEYLKVARFVSEPRDDNPSFGHWEPSFTSWKAAR